MKTFLIVIAVLAVVVLIIVFRKQIGAFFSPGTKDGDACTDTNGNASTYQDGVCKEVINPPIGDTVRIERFVPRNITVRRYNMNCLSRIRVNQYPGIVWNLTGSNRFFCFYSR